MKQRIAFILRFYLTLVAVFLVQKPLFMAYHSSLYASASPGEWLQVMLHGIPLDLATAGYLTTLPLLALSVSCWTCGGWFRRFMQGYVVVVSLLLGVIFVVDLELYGYWGFRLDSTPFFYLASPADAAASISTGALLLGLAVVLLSAFLIACLLRTAGYRRAAGWQPVSRKAGAVLLPLLGGALLFLAIRGGFSVATMNVGQVYFSTRMPLNHAAINPAFSLAESLSRNEAFDRQYRYFEPEEAETIVREYAPQVSRPFVPVDSARFTAERPDILIVILESFGAGAVEAVGGEPGVTPVLNRLAGEGLLFTRFYANSFRTDRGLVSILSGYPAQPTTSIMKYPAKSQTLPNISKTLAGAGYNLAFFYGGDIDFTNMRSYFVSGGFRRIVSDVDFSVSERLSKWGAPDEQLFDRLSQELAALPSPFLAVALTLSSHEPFEVPLHKFDHPYLNSVAYTDSCLGVFLDRFRQTPQWDRTLVVLLPDHGYRYPASLQNHSIDRYHIPMIWTGGALRRGSRFEAYASQTDLPALLLGQIGLPYDDFGFSRNRFDPADTTGYAFYTFKNGFGVLDPEGAVVYDCEAGQVIERRGSGVERKEQFGKAFLQRLYDDLSRR